jgi:hypothetical protein
MTTRISTLPSLAAVTDTTIIPVVEGGATKKITGAALKTYTGSGGTPGGSNTQIQYNSSGAFAGSSNFTFNSSGGVIRGSNFVTGSGNSNFGIGITDTPAVNKGGRLSLTTNITAQDNWIAAAISGRTSNTGSYATYLTMETCTAPGVSVEVLRLAENAPVVLQGGSTSATGTGIAFPATQNASTNANTLDDYEEGTFTPVLVGSTSGAYSNTNYNTGRYVKIGKYVWIELEVQVSNSFQPVGDLTITGLPFTSVNYYNYRYPLSVDLSYVTFDNTKRWSANVRVNSTVIDIVQNVSAGVSIAVTGANLANTNSSQRYMGFYEVA